jgi:DDE superfamily endonuclease
LRASFQFGNGSHSFAALRRAQFNNFIAVSPCGNEPHEYAYAAVSPHDGVLDTLVLPTVNAEARGMFLAEVARRPADEFIWMVLDGAGWHRAKRLQMPENLRLIPLPPWSPQLNPAEHLWEEVREKWFAKRQFIGRDQRETQLVAGLANLEADAPRMASLTGFDWITCVSPNAS